MKNIEMSMFLTIIWMSLMKNLYCTNLPNDITHCDSTSVIDGKFQSENLDAQLTLSLKNYQLELSFNKTICIKATVPNNGNETSFNSSKTNPNTTLLYTLRYQGMRQVYPISSEYVFGIPQFESQCKCDCSGGDDHCPAGDSYKNCPVENGICVTTEHNHQKSAGCPTGAEAKLCCKVTVAPYNNTKFHAVYLDQPSFEGQFLFKVYVQQDEKWEPRNQEIIFVSLNSDHRQDFRGFQITIRSPSVNTKLSPDMYFYMSNLSTLSQLQSSKKIPINKLYDWSTNQVGWFRFLNDKWTLNDDLAKIPDNHKVTVNNCKDQTYTASYSNVQYYCTKNNTHKYCSKDADLTHPQYSVKQTWISRIILPTQENTVERQILVEMDKNSPSITVTLNLDSRIELKFLHHESDVKDFSALIVFDKRSNKFLNITYVGAKGTITGTVYCSDSNRVFSSEIAHNDRKTEHLSNFTDIISISPEIISSKNVCIHPYGKPSKEFCKIVEYHSVPLEEFLYEKNDWMQYKGNCPGCNEFTWSNILKYLDPRQWFNNVTSVGDVFSRIVDIGFYFIIFILIVFICRRCCCPFLKIVLCYSNSSTNKKPLGA